MVHLLHFLCIPEPLLLSSSDAAELVERTWTTFGVSFHQNATIISRLVCAACVQVFVKGKVIRLFFWKFFAAVEEKQIGVRWLWSVPGLTAPPGRAQVYNWTKAGMRNVLQESRNREGGGRMRVYVCVHAYLCLLFCPSCHLKSEHPPPPRSWQQWDKRTETLQQGQAGETVAAQSSGLATDSFRKKQTPWNEELRIKL